MTMRGTYLGDMRCELEHGATGAKILTDAHHDGSDRTGAWYPPELCGAALGTCAMTVLTFVAKRLNVSVEGAKFEVEQAMTADQHRLAKVAVTFIMPPGVYEPKIRKQFERAVLKCPVHASLHPDIEQVFNFVWPDEA